MYASVRTYRFGSGSADDLMHRVDRDFADALAQEPGFVAYQVIETGRDRLMSISIFRNREDAERSNQLAAQWVAEDLAEFEVERVGAITGEVSVSRAAAEIMEPAHA
jgi:quinol monooxygenase YgiN